MRGNFDSKCHVLCGSGLPKIGATSKIYSREIMPHEKKALVVQVLPEESQSPQQEASAPAGASPRKTEATAVRKCRSSSVGSTEDGNQSVARECGDTNGRQKQSTITATTETAAAIGKGSTGTATAASTAVVERADLERLFASLYPGLPEEDGLRASRNERLSRGYGSVSLTYGEISAFGFLDVLERIRHAHGLPEKGGVFYDLGCGTGKPVFAAAAASAPGGLFRRCVGLEILSGLHEICRKALERWNQGAKDAVAGRGPATEVEFVCGDFTVLDWSDGDLVFANSTCFDEVLMRNLARGAEALKEGAIVVTTTDPLPSAAFEVVEEECLQTVMTQAGRSATSCFVQRRLPKPPRPAERSPDRHHVDDIHGRTLSS